MAFGALRSGRLGDSRRRVMDRNRAVIRWLMLTVAILSFSAASFSQVAVGVSVRVGAFYYNRYVTNVSVTNVTHVYNRSVEVNNTRTTSYNGGTGGVEARPTV